MSCWCQKLTMMLPEGYVLYKDKMVFHLRIKSLPKKYLKVSTERFCLTSFHISCFYKLLVVIQEAFSEWHFD